MIDEDDAQDDHHLAQDNDDLAGDNFYGKVWVI